MRRHQTAGSNYATMVPQTVSLDRLIAFISRNFKNAPGMMADMLRELKSTTSLSPRGRWGLPYRCNASEGSPMWSQKQQSRRDVEDAPAGGCRNPRRTLRCKRTPKLGRDVTRANAFRRLVCVGAPLFGLNQPGRTGLARTKLTSQFRRKATWSIIHVYHCRTHNLP